MQIGNIVCFFNLLPLLFRKKIRVNLALVGLALGFSYFLCGRIAGGKTNQKLDRIDTEVTETKETGKQLDASFRDNVVKDSLNNIGIVREIRGNRQKIEEIGKPPHEKKSDHLKKWKDSQGNEIIKSEISPEIDSFLKNAKKGRVVDLNKN